MTGDPAGPVGGVRSTVAAHPATGLTTATTGTSYMHLAPGTTRTTEAPRDG